MRTRPPFVPALLMVWLVMLLGGCDAAQETPPKAERSRPAQLFTVRNADAAMQREFPATVQAWRSASLAFRVPGTLEALPAQAGQEVSQGQLLARLDSTDYRRVLDEREARFELARIRYRQQESLLARNYTSEVSLDEARAELKAAQAALNIARDNLGYTRLEAPFSGVISRLQTENFQQVQAQQPVLLLQDESRLDIRFGVPESIISRLRPDLEPNDDICGQVRFTAHPAHEFTACYAEHEVVSDNRTRSYEVVFRMERPEAFPAHSGMSVEMKVNLAPLLQPVSQPGLPVPVGAVFMRDGYHWVWRLDADSRARALAVTPLQVRGSLMLIEAELSPGDQLVAAGVSRVREGMRLHAIPRERGL
ncbi:efflux RND transporter periplasmic adaptor subunit [Marinobacterium weihaiense]|uniref:Efflux RND transporter periplasmic adaptor subunit n=1 Tax=Marinobacterium weihaiense TaxID=2851016 RepID=A0ABS6MBA1_9GAMM|nr:efflux RND transporter periplasmic adaptor subunit [Marinobacterium weihaiense]MBV0933450.1 efflux RND transporter periplasmic adaptor subunit [Marinobacterium weihaiense]